MSTGAVSSALRSAVWAPPAVLELAELRIGEMLAEGGEGQVHVLPRQPHLVLKLFRRPADADSLTRLVGWPLSLPPPAEAVVRAASAWPVSVVRGEGGRAAGLLVPRAPRRFSVRHRDGHSRLASLSYLTADPEHRAVAYGLSLPPPAGAERVGIVYALARLLSAFEATCPGVGHGDLSTKNVLWSLQRGPEVFVIDCDSSELFGPDAMPTPGPQRRRAMTPNWDDPGVPPGANPSAATDRYSLALIFLRVVGAANFPVQARQRSGDTLEVRFPVPPGPGAQLLMDPSAPLWNLCARSLSLAGGRPPAKDWLQPLESLLEAMGASRLTEAVWAAQGGGSPSPPPELVASERSGVVVQPERAPRRSRAWSRVSPAPRHGSGPSSGRSPSPSGFRVPAQAPSWSGPNRPPAPGGLGPGGSGTNRLPSGAQGGSGPTWVRPSTLNQPWLLPPGGGRGAAGGAPGSRPPSPWTSAGASAPIWPDLRNQLGRFFGWWFALHRAMWAVFTGRDRSRPVRAIVACLAVDFVITVLLGASLALIISPITQG